MIGIKRLKPAAILLSALGGLLILAACYADAERIRESNAAAGSSSKSDQLTGLTGKISVFDLRDGDCFDAPEIPEFNTVDLYDVELVACSGDWRYRALNSFVVDLDGDYPGAVYFDTVSDTRCNRLTNSFMFPYLESWEIGDRTVLCLMEK